MKFLNQIHKKSNPHHLRSERQQEVNRTGEALSPTRTRLKKRIAERQEQQSALKHATAPAQMNTFGLCVTLLLIAGKATEVNGQIIKNKEIKQICSSTELSLYNKPQEVKIGAKNGQFMPAICTAHPSSVGCSSESTLLKNFEFDVASTSDRDRQLIEGQFFNWENRVFPNAQAIAHGLNRKQTKIFKNAYSNIELLVKYYLHAYIAEHQQAGNCAEHAAVNLFKLLKYQIKTNQPLKIQMVAFLNSQTTQAYKLTGNSKLFPDHQFLLINSNVPEITIENDLAQVNTFINSLKGTICDTWNRGHFVEIDKDKTGLYNNEARWDTVKVQTIPLYPKELEQLPDHARLFLCQILEDMGLKDNRPRQYNPCFFGHKNQQEDVHPEELVADKGISL